ncbi:MAG: mannosyltransferase putative-domain-containing protein [Linnemannia gamsii]|nr:MAG: mannosyltransferase putative-domain-containing protein [Linnemannia gamsii]
MKILAFISGVLRKPQNLRILIVITIFFVLASFSRYQGSVELSIDEDGQVQSMPTDVDNMHVTHHIATYKEDDIKPWTLGDTAALRTLQGQKVVEALTATPYQVPGPDNDNEETRLKPDHFLTLTKRFRIYRSLWKHLQGYYDSSVADHLQEEFFTTPPKEIAPAVDFLQRIEQVTFPWIFRENKSGFDLYNKSRNGGRGIVMCVGNYHAKYARTAIKALREVVKTKLPIEIFYTGEPDLSPENIAWFESIEGVKTIDVVTLIENKMVILEGWAAKPFAMMVSSFSEVIMMDSDVQYMIDPALLFEDPGYKETGTLYFYDRTLFPGAGRDKKAWMESFLPTMSNHPAKTRWFRAKGDHEMESGVVVFNKKEHFVGLLAICKLNDLHERRQVTYQKTWGDKETFWIALEMVQERYSFIRYGGGVIGNVGDAIPFNGVLPKEEIDRYNQGEDLVATNPKDLKTGLTKHIDKPNRDRVCGNLMHFDPKGQPLWWNSGVVRNKFVKNSPYLKYTAFMRDEDGDWEFDSTCLVQKNPGAIMEVDWEQRKLAFEVLKVDREVALEYNDENIKDILDIPKLQRSEGAKGGHGNSEAI